MNKTHVDDMLIEMITPKVKQIEEKFGNGEGLTQDDINTLLLKSQYNHINHLDIKLDEVTADVASLKGEFHEFKNEVNIDLKEFKNGIDAEFKEFKNEINTEFSNLRGDFQLLRGEFQTFKMEIMAENEKRFGSMDAKFESLKTDIQTTINNTMKWYIGGTGVILVALKSLDIFVK